MSSTSNQKRPPAPKPKTEKPGKLLRTQKQPATATPKPDAPPPSPKPTQIETVTLASGEKRSVTIEATNDKEWNDLVTLAEGASALSLDQKDVTHRTISAIAALRVAHEDDWKPYCERRGMKWRKEAKSAFQAAAMWVLNRMKAATGENHTSKASMIAGCLDEYWEMQRPKGMKPNDIARWLDDSGGYTTVYRDRLDRLRDPKDKIAERYGRYLTLPPQEQRDIPKWLSGFDGEVVISAHINRSSGKLEYRSVWQPEGSSFWYSRLDQFIAARPDYGKAVEPVRARDAQHVIDGASEREDAATDQATEDNADATDPVPARDVAQLESDDDKPLDPETRATLDSIRANLDASMADLAAKRVEANAEPARDVEHGSGAPLACKLARGCRYGGCQGWGRCLAHQENTGRVARSEHADAD
jgi:hypothetical protein